MNIFDIDDYESEYGTSIAMACRTEEDARCFLAYLDSVGRKWCNGQKYDENDTHFDVAIDVGVVYYFNAGMWDFETNADEDTEILVFSDFDWSCFTDPERQSVDASEVCNISFDEMFFGSEENQKE